VRVSTLAKSALNLARRLDGGPADREATMIARELRLTIAELHRLVPEGVTDDVEAFLARVSASDLGHTAD
jgi:hypothetical protein